MAAACLLAGVAAVAAACRQHYVSICSDWVVDTGPGHAVQPMSITKGDGVAGGKDGCVVSLHPQAHLAAGTTISLA